ncbi:L,D-transpeptidase [Labrys wisconsinensis]
MAPAGQPAARPRSGLGGGFIEFLFNGGAMDEPARPLPRSRRAPAYAVQPPDPYAAPRPARRRPAEARIAYAAPPANDVRPARGEVAAQFRKQTVPYDGPQAPGTIVIDTAQRYLFLVQEGGTALRYGVGVGRAGFEWNGTSAISRKAEWPDWRPPAEMRKRRPDLPAFMAGGPRNPLGARAMYLGDTLYRIHGSNEPQSIGQAVSSGCIRMRNEDVIDLYERVGIGTTVVVL